MGKLFFQIQATQKKGMQNFVLQNVIESLISTQTEKHAKRNIVLFVSSVGKHLNVKGIPLIEINIVPMNVLNVIWLEINIRDGVVGQRTIVRNGRKHLEIGFVDGTHIIMVVL